MEYGHYYNKFYSTSLFIVLHNYYIIHISEKIQKINQNTSIKNMYIQNIYFDIHFLVHFMMVFKGPLLGLYIFMEL